MNSILVILPNNLGDIIMALPMMEGLKAEDPGRSISFLVEDGFEAGIENNPFCDEIIKFPRKHIRDHGMIREWEKALTPLRDIIERIAASHYDTIINLCQHTYVSFLVPLMKGRVVLGRQFLKEGNQSIGDCWSQYLYAIPFSRSSNALHAADVYRRIAGVTEHRGGYSIVITAKEKAWALDFLQKRGVDFQNKIMLFQPGAAFPSKCWPAEHFICLGRMLTHEGWQILISGAPSEKDNAMQISQGIGKNCFIIAGETQFRQAISICALTKGCVTGDTALMHAASGLNVPTYALFGPTNPVETGPYGNGNWVFSAHCLDRPCFKTICFSDSCMRSIAPETVFSCIEGGNPGMNPPCDVYITETEKNGDFRLVAVSWNAHSYYDKITAWLARKAFEPEIEGSFSIGSGKEASVQITEQWLEAIEKMKATLEKYLETRDSSAIGEFEREKQALACFNGIGEFWTAMLNIRLNSIPLLNPLEGIVQSVEVCNETMKQIRDAFP
jgi:heptosyltransferase I